MSAQVTELLTQYGPVASIWLDGIGVPMSRDKSKFKCQELYDLVHSLQPQVLLSYKQGLLGTEDYFAPEHKVVANAADKPMEICTTLQKGGWGFKKNANHVKIDGAMKKLKAARAGNANLLLNTGPKPDGSIHPTDLATLREMGRRIRAKGFPGEMKTRDKQEK